MTNNLRHLKQEIRRYHNLIRKSNGIQKDVYIESMNVLIEKREEIERGMSEEAIPEVEESKEETKELPF